MMSLIILKLVSLFLYGFLALNIWCVITRRFLIEKIFSLILVFFLLSFWLLLNGLEFLPLVILLLYVGAISILFLFMVMILNPDYQLMLLENASLKAKFNLRFFRLSSLNNLVDIYTINFNTFNKFLYKNLTNNSFIIFNSFFSLGVLLGFFFSFLYSWINFINFKFVLSSNFLSKVTQVYSTNTFENILQTQLGSLTNVLPLVFNFSDIKIQSYYYPLWFQKNEVVNIGLLLYTKYGIGLLLIGVLLLISMIGVIILSLKYTNLVKKQYKQKHYFI